MRVTSASEDYREYVNVEFVGTTAARLRRIMPTQARQSISSVCDRTASPNTS